MKLQNLLLPMALLLAVILIRRASNETISSPKGVFTPAPERIIQSGTSNAELSSTTPVSALKSPAAVTLREWLQSTGANTTSTVQAQNVEQLAREHRSRIAKLIVEDPAAALRESLTWSEWAALTPAIQALVERPFSQKVDFEKIAICPGAENIHPYRVTVDGERHDAYLYGSKLQTTSKSGLPVRGIILDGKVALAESELEVLSGADLAAAQSLYPTGTLVSGNSATEKALDDSMILWGGTLYQYSSEQQLNELAAFVQSAEKSFNPHAFAMAYQAGVSATGTNATFNLQAASAELSASSTWTETPKKALALRINYADGTGYSFTPSEMTNLLNNASNSVKIMSYGKTWLVPRIVSVTLPQNYQAYQDGGPDLIVNDTRTALNAMGINRDAYDFVIHAHPQMNFSYAGLGVIGGANNWLNGHVSLEVAVHEIGHNYGLGHAHYWSSFTASGSLGHTQPDGSLAEREEYGDPFDIMGGSTLPAGEYNAHGKAALNWIESEEVINVVTNGIYRVYRYDHKDARTNSNTTLALKVASPGGDEYWVSHRKLFPSNASLYRGANIVRADGTGDQSLIDTTPLSRANSAFSNDRTDSGLLLAKSFSDPLGTVRITTIASGGTAPREYIDVQVAFQNDGAFSFYTGPDLATNGLVGSYVNRSLQSRPNQDDWRAASGVVVSGKRIDERLSFTGNGWGARAPLRLTGGSDADWDNFSVQWDGVIVVRRPVQLATVSDDSSRFWIDLDHNGSFGTTAPELVNNHWGSGQGPTRGELSPVIPPGQYNIRIQYQEGAGGNYFTLIGADLPFELFTTQDESTPGLTASFVATDLRSYTAQNDWRTSQDIAGTRVDEYPAFTVTSWGNLADVGLTPGVNGTDSDWDNFSVQWDGWLKVSAPVRMATVSDDQSRMWIDLNSNGTFSTTAPELINNGWGGGGQGMTVGQISTIIQPGKYRIRIQYEEGAGGNGFMLAGVPQAPTDAAVLVSGAVFSGAENRVVLNQLDSDFTISFWMQSSQIAGTADSWTNGMGIIDANAAPGDLPFGVTLGEGRVLFGTGGPNATTIASPDIVADGAWHFISARRSQNLLTLFLDGIPVGSAVASSESVSAIADFTVGSLSGSRNYLVGSVDQLRTWDSARSDAQIAADYYLTRNGHGFQESAPVTRIEQLQPGSVQVFWDALSGYRILEGAAAVEGPWFKLPTDQNSTNIPMASPMRFFRVRQ